MTSTDGTRPFVTVAKVSAMAKTIGSTVNAPNVEKWRSDSFYIYIFIHQAGSKNFIECALNVLIFLDLSYPECRLGSHRLRMRISFPVPPWNYLHVLRSGTVIRRGGYTCGNNVEIIRPVPWICKLFPFKSLIFFDFCHQRTWNKMFWPMFWLLCMRFQLLVAYSELLI